MNNYIIGAIILVILYFIFHMSKYSEHFTLQETALAGKIVESFKANKDSTFIAYLTVLNDNKNTSDNLISKGVYNKFKNNTNLTIDDVLKEF